jgi:DNA (cytosine-5)-methyltransferase 1
VLFSDDAGEPEDPPRDGRACGFYWTEGIRGLGWAIDAIPTLKGGSSLGIPSPPAIWMPSGLIATPDIRDAERLQGFPADWTAPALGVGRGRTGGRWKLIGNAVSVPVFAWVGSQLLEHASYDGASMDRPLADEERWPAAAWGSRGKTCAASVSSWPVRRRHRSLAPFLKNPISPLSIRATAGFLDRVSRSRLRFPSGFVEAVENHLTRMQEKEEAGVFGQSRSEGAA